MTDFDRIDVSGPFVVTVETGKSPSARATGSAAALDRLTIETRGRTLRVVPAVGGWGGWPGAKSVPATIKITVPGLREVSLRGGGSLSVTKMRAQIVRLGLSGSGALSVGQIETDRLFAALIGSGTVTLGGKAAIARVTSEGSGTIAADSLVIDALEALINSAGVTTLMARKTARVTSGGTGAVTIGGTPACTVAATGAGQVSCGANGSDQR